MFSNIIRSQFRFTFNVCSRFPDLLHIGVERTATARSGATRASRNATKNGNCKNRKKKKRTVCPQSKSGRSFRRPWCPRRTRATTTDFASRATAATTMEPERDVELRRRRLDPRDQVGEIKRKDPDPDPRPVRGPDQVRVRENHVPDRARENQDQDRPQDPESRGQDLARENLVQDPGPARDQSRDPFRGQGLVQGRDLPRRNAPDLPVLVDQNLVHPGPDRDRLVRNRDLRQEKEAIRINFCFHQKNSFEVYCMFPFFSSQSLLDVLYVLKIIFNEQKEIEKNFLPC